MPEEEHTMIRDVETYTVFSRLSSLLLIGDFRTVVCGTSATQGARPSCYFPYLCAQEPLR
jgi:hypothetical protein